MAQNIRGGVVEEIIGKAGVHETEMRALALGQGFSPDFPPGVVAEAKILKNTAQRCLQKRQRIPMRRDFRNVPTCTIDPFDAKDFDDALSVQKLADGTIEVGVHIAEKLSKNIVKARAAVTKPAYPLPEAVEPAQASQVRQVR